MAANARVLGSPKRTALGLAIGLLAGALLAATQFPAAGNDDTHITYWAAHALAHYGSILNYNGEHLEQSSSLLLVLLLALVHGLFGLPLPATAWVLGIAAALAALVVATKLAQRVDPEAAPFVALLAATSLPFAY